MRQRVYPLQKSQRCRMGQDDDEHWKAAPVGSAGLGVYAEIGHGKGGIGYP